MKGLVVATIDASALQGFLKQPEQDPIDPTTVTGQLTALLVKSAGVDPQDVTETATFASLGVDSIALVQLAVELEEQFGIIVHDGDFQATTTIGELEQLIAAKQANQES
ncbi:acyl carrier protein [Corynebacterium choanae]|uniref:Acyl carrier protein n=1 Tax=Corynebacterium choanae TaxID=1862358 RepID=A0A3G6JCZ3_9CORY|nr:acyl carrier protein [Corynebacterium choanae]AZA14024.1 Acyl carrier protein [Corynebacterium choanae]